MQALARQMNLSETTFVLPASAEGADARVRIFTPNVEVPFAGHPTLGTASIVAASRPCVTLELGAGLVPVRRDGTAWTLRTATTPVARVAAATRSELNTMLGLPEGAICDEPLWVSTGIEQLIIPIATPELVLAARPVPELVGRHGFSAAYDVAMAYLWAPDVVRPDLVTARFFFTSSGALIEDPATGSACANLGGWMIARGVPRPLSLSLSQGTAVGRPSRLGLRVDEHDQIFVRGSVSEVGRGSFELRADAL